MTYDGVWHLRYIMGVHFFLVWHRVHWISNSASLGWNRQVCEIAAFTWVLQGWALFTMYIRNGIGVLGYEDRLHNMYIIMRSL